MNDVANLKKELKSKSGAKRAEVLQGFFKTGEGGYGESDVFIGVTVPDIRKVAKKYNNFSLSSIEKLLKSKIHEERLAGLLILVEQFESGMKKKEIYDPNAIFRGLRLEPETL